MPNKVAVIGLGFVGLPLVQLLIKKNNDVIGIETDVSKINFLSQGKSYLSDLSDKEVGEIINSGCFHPTSNYQKIKEAKNIIICVPTPLRNRQPDLSYVTAAVEAMVPYIQEETLIILESSTYPGTTEKLLQPLLEKAGFAIGKNIYLAYSPERIDPGNTILTLETIPKVVSGVTEPCLKRIQQFYSDIFKTTVPVSSPSVAEFTKILENSQRLINISFMNEVNLIANKMNINMWEAIEAAKTKPVGFTPYYPGPGIGGHCIPIDPFYLSWVGMQEGIHLSMIHQAGVINELMPYRVVNEIMNYLKVLGKENGTVGIIGLTYKKDVNDLRESPAWKVTEILGEKNVCVRVYDPYFANADAFDRFNLTAEELETLDLTVILVDHSNIDWDLVVNNSKQIIDTRNITKDYHSKNIKRI
ncbi:nucleotide sugar dehydrogenase [Anaerobacillus isosaccharinicus]|uniref:Nucleotide sugar dehydrogenase n=1 Tax=Anaerobacillus isosaccharinicus TaxID=1532552 RepID=A0A7S7L4D5_9BACI|nr:nucleotide sugar dehydrogenase [Anaerobacillus isosaccharinicus]MBA5587607.1 nucleotide sugar dehydrogenase [Anaerobacillus isosaccharinicus]QOY34216.1 nucleotide sugar dehydrogenase [Anaerobacillus isosaccharinicus]